MLILLVLFLLTVPGFSQDRDLSATIDSLINQYQPVEAESMLLDFHNQNHDSSEANYLLGILYFHKEQTDKAINHLKTAIELDRDEADYYFALGNAYAQKAAKSGIITAYRVSKKMRSAFEKTLEINPDHRQASLYLFQYHLQTPGLLGGNRDRAREFAKGIVASDSSLGHYLLALYWEKEGDEKMTETELLRSLKSEPQNIAVLNYLGYFYLRQRTPAKSYPYFQRAIEAAPETANVYDSMGDYFAAVAEYDSAFQYYQKAIERDSTFTVSIYNKARMLEVLGKPGEAQKVYLDLAARFPADQYGKLAKMRANELD